MASHPDKVMLRRWTKNNGGCLLWKPSNSSEVECLPLVYSYFLTLRILLSSVTRTTLHFLHGSPNFPILVLQSSATLPFLVSATLVWDRWSIPYLLSVSCSLVCVLRTTPIFSFPNFPILVFDCFWVRAEKIMGGKRARSFPLLSSTTVQSLNLLRQHLSLSTFSQPNVLTELSSFILASIYIW